jgi:hypothetical protein
MQEQLTGRPVRFGQANPGMQDKGEDYDGTVLTSFTANEAWDAARHDALFWSKAFYEAGYHKQVYNRLTEPFQMMKTVLSGTEFENFFWLRDDGAADPTIAELAGCMRDAKNESTPMQLQPREWHLPYLDCYRDEQGVLHYGGADPEDGWTEYSLQDAIKTSCARCAAVSFRNVDYGLGKCREVYDRLVGDERKHASAFEHQGSPMKTVKAMGQGYFIPPVCWEYGVSHMDKEYNLWSGNLKGWIQYRKTIPGENYQGK